MDKKQLIRQPRAKVMLPAIKQRIVLRATTADNATKDRYTLAAELIDEIKEKYPREIPPTEDTLVHMISKARNQAKNPLDREFSLSDLNNLELEMQNISAEAIRHIMRVQKWLESQDSMVGYKSLTIRQARWVTRLYGTVEDNLSMPSGKTTIDIPTLQLWQAAYIYADYELVCEKSKTPFNTDVFDRGLRQGISALLKIYESKIGSI